MRRVACYLFFSTIFSSNVSTSSQKKFSPRVFPVISIPRAVRKPQKVRRVIQFKPIVEDDETHLETTASSPLSALLLPTAREDRVHSSYSTRTRFAT